MTNQAPPAIQELREAEDKAAEAHRRASWTRKGARSRKRQGEATQKRIQATAAALAHATAQRMEAESERRKNWYKTQFEGKKPAEQKAVYTFWLMKLTHDRGNCPQAIAELTTAYQEATT